MKLYRALLELEKTCPELFWVLKSTVINEIKDGPGVSAYAAKSRDGFKIGINEKWIKDFDTYNLAAILEHELLHIVFEHVLDMTKFDDPQLANEAQDYIINDIATFFKDKKRLNKELSQGCFLENLNKNHNQSFNSRQHSSLDIYKFLEKEKAKNPKSGGFKLSFDKGMDESQNDKGADGQSMSQETQDLLDKIAQDTLGMAVSKPGEKREDEVKVEKGELDPNQKVIGQLNQETGGGLDGVLSNQQIQDILKTYSKSSADIRQYFENIEKLKKNKAIRNEIEKFFSSNKTDFKRSIKKINKRFNFIPYGRHADKKQTCLVALDVSGSMMNKEDLEKLKMSVTSAVGNGYKVDLIFGDTRKLGGFKDIKPNFDFTKIFGGGGTDLKFIFDEAVKDYDVIVITTDGCFDHSDIPKQLKNRILFLITSTWGKQHVPGFKNIDI